MMYRAKEAKQSDQPRLYRIVKEVSHLAKLPMPKVYIIPSNSSNAFATYVITTLLSQQQKEF